MASRVWNRPRTRVYASNYDAGESYYKSALDNLDRKYGRSPAPAEPSVANGNHSSNGTSSMSALRASLERERDRPARHINFDDEEIETTPRRKPKTAALLEEFDSIFDRKAKNGVSRERTPSRTLKAFEDDADQEFAESMKRVKAARAARAAAEDMEEIEQNLTSRKKETRSKLDFSSKMIDSISGSEDSSATRKKILSIVSAPTDSEDMTRWTAIKSNNRRAAKEEESDESGAAVARARQSRARLQDLEAEMTALEERGAAREKRVRDLRSLLSENEASSKETLHSTIRVKSTVHTEKKQVAF